MARGQCYTLKCANLSCLTRMKARSSIGNVFERIHGEMKPIVALGKIRERHYTHGNNTGLPDSTHEWQMQCLQCGRVFWSRHPGAKTTYRRMFPDAG